MGCRIRGPPVEALFGGLVELPDMSICRPRQSSVPNEVLDDPALCADVPGKREYPPVGIQVGPTNIVFERLGSVEHHPQLAGAVHAEQPVLERNSRGSQPRPRTRKLCHVRSQAFMSCAGIQSLE